MPAGQANKGQAGQVPSAAVGVEPAPGDVLRRGVL